MCSLRFSLSHQHDHWPGCGIESSRTWPFELENRDIEKEFLLPTDGDRPTFIETNDLRDMPPARLLVICLSDAILLIFYDARCICVNAFHLGERRHKMFHLLSWLRLSLSCYKITSCPSHLDEFPSSTRKEYWCICIKRGDIIIK